MRKHTSPLICTTALVLLLAACTPKQVPQPAASATTDASAATAAPPEQTCTNEPRTDDNDKRPRCGGMGVAAAPHAYHVVGGSGDPVDETVCDISQSFVLNGRMFGVEFSGGVDGTYKFVRTPNIPGLHWSAGGRYHIEFADGADKPGTLTTEGGGTTTAGSQSRTTSGGEHFTLTPTAACDAANQRR
jgi:hypothetical protein